MTCDKCKETAYKLRCVHGKWFCKDCIPYESSGSFMVVPTVNFKWYDKNGGNVSARRVEMVKNRCLAPDGNGEVVMKQNGRVTDKRAYNY